MKRIVKTSVVVALIVALLVLGYGMVRRNGVSSTAATYGSLADEYAASQLASFAAEQQTYIERGLTQYNGKTGQDGLTFLQARVELLEYADTYENYDIYRYQCGYRPNDIGLAVEVGPLEVDGQWLSDKTSNYLVYRTDGAELQLVGRLVTEFSPTGSADQFYADLRSWLEENTATD